MIDFKLYTDTLPQKKKNENVFFHRKLCFKETSSLDRIISMFDDYDVEDVWINGEPVDIEESRLFSKDEVPEIILAEPMVQPVFTRSRADACASDHAEPNACANHNTNSRAVPESRTGTNF